MARKQAVVCSDCGWHGERRYYVLDAMDNPREVAGYGSCKNCGSDALEKRLNRSAAMRERHVREQLGDKA